VLAQDISTYADIDSAGVAARDRIMAENFRRLVDRESPGTRFVFWGHNGHVATGGNSLFKPVGAYLRETYDSAYYALGFSFNAGTFLARDVTTADSSRQHRKRLPVEPGWRNHYPCEVSALCTKVPFPPLISILCSLTSALMACYLLLPAHEPTQLHR
jgi:erythromycin esterase-like protein